MTKKIYELKQLLSLYYGGLSTPDNEKRMIDLFGEIGDQLPADLIVERDVMTALSSAKNQIEIPSGMDKRLSLLVDKLERQESRRFIGRRWITLAGVAASLAILVTIITFIVKNSSPNPHEITDPQTAFNETERALMMVSESLNRTDAVINEAGTTLSKITFLDDSLFEDDDEEPVDGPLPNDSNAIQL